jgi:peptidoglycan/xylan/chitin deacetylase (PgdA/CDA1 family)
VDPRFDFGITRVTPGRFAGQIEAALDQGFTFCTLSEFLQKPLSKSIALTFDDGFASIFQHAYPVLKEHQIRATIFIIAGFTGQFDDWDVNFARIRFPHLNWLEIEKLFKEGWQIESHSLYHNDLTKIGKSACLRELELSRSLIEKRLQNTVCHISYPFGNTDADVIESCRQTGYGGGVVMSRNATDLPASFVIPRLGVYLFDTKTTFLHKILAKYEKTYKFMQRAIDVCSDGTVLVKHGMQVTKK